TKRFPSHDEKKKAKRHKKNVPISSNDSAASSLYTEFVSPQDEGETRAFLNAVSGVTKLGASANAKSKKRRSVNALENPVLGKHSLHNPEQSYPKKKKNTAPETVNKVVVSPAPERMGNETDEQDINFFAAMQDVTPLSGKGREVAA